MTREMFVGSVGLDGLSALALHEREASRDGEVGHGRAACQKERERDGDGGSVSVCVSDRRGEAGGRGAGEKKVMS